MYIHFQPALLVVLQVILLLQLSQLPAWLVTQALLDNTPAVLLAMITALRR
jgi:hypothetical protein